MAGHVRFGKCREIALRALAPVATLAIIGGGLIVFSSPSASAATPSTDTIFVSNPPTTEQVPLPAGTPDVMPTLVPAVLDACGPITQAEANADLLEGSLGVPFTLSFTNLSDTGVLSICQASFPKGFAFIIAGTSGVALAIPSGPFFGGWACEVALYTPGPAIGIAGPQTFC
jgi:hypothetical protein